LGSLIFLFYKPGLDINTTKCSECTGKFDPGILLESFRQKKQQQQPQIGNGKNCNLSQLEPKKPEFPVNTSSRDLHKTAGKPSGSLNNVAGGFGKFASSCWIKRYGSSF